MDMGVRIIIVLLVAPHYRQQDSVKTLLRALLQVLEFVQTHF